VGAEAPALRRAPSFTERSGRLSRSGRKRRRYCAGVRLTSRDLDGDVEAHGACDEVEGEIEPRRFFNALQGRAANQRANRAGRAAKLGYDAPSLDAAVLRQEYRALTTRLRNLNVLGGCCGTDHRHVQAIAGACAGQAAQAA
jgi:hypothetical protein